MYPFLKKPWSRIAIECIVIVYHAVEVKSSVLLKRVLASIDAFSACVTVNICKRKKRRKEERRGEKWRKEDLRVKMRRKEREKEREKSDFN